MVKLGRAVINGTLLKPATHNQQMTTMSFNPYNPSPGIAEGPATFGYGLGMVQIGSWFGHDGSLPGYGTAMMGEPYTGTIICVAENKQTTGLQAMSRIWHRIANHFYNGSADTVGFFA
jgi:D-alanyl-D-alanine carboxypeptidase